MSIFPSFKQGIRQLYPGYFALVMATGVIAIAASYLQIAWLAWTLFHFAEAAYLALWLLTLGRLIFYPGELFRDLGSHARGPGFFTIVAATCVLGSGYVILGGELGVARVLWYVGLALWLVLMYTFFTAIMICAEKPGLAGGINGAWLLIVVATQGVALLGALIAPSFSAGRDELLFFSLLMYLLGGMLYILLISLIFYRFTFFRLTPQEFEPSYWIDMGAEAISCLAGTTLIMAAPEWPFLQALLPFLKGQTLLLWATGNWWIPLLLILAIWRHLIKGVPLSYTPQYWAVVFPFGMYTACTFDLARAMGLDFLFAIPRVSIYFALLVWLLAAVGMVHGWLLHIWQDRTMTSSRPK